MDKEVVKLYLDDVRPLPDDSWTLVTSYYEFVAYIEENGLPDEISFDHDLGDVNSNIERTGKDCANWLTEHCLDNDLDLPEWNIHSANAVGRKNITTLLNNFTKHMKAELFERIKGQEIGGIEENDVWTPTINGKAVKPEVRDKLINDMGRFQKYI